MPTIALELLSSRGWYADRSPETKRLLAPLFQLREYSAGQSLYNHGDEPNGVFGIASGGIDISIPRFDGLAFTIHRAETGFWIGDSALFAGYSRMISIVATAQVRAVFLPRAPLLKLVEENPFLYKDFYALSHINTQTALNLLANLATSPAEARVAVRLLMYEPNGGSDANEISLSHEKLAELVALSPATMQRVLASMQEQRLIEVSYSRIRILNRGGLLALCAKAR